MSTARSIVTKLATTRLILLLLLALVANRASLANANKNANGSNNFRVVLDSPPGHDKKTRLMLKNRILQHTELDLPALVERARKEFHDVSLKTRELTSKVQLEAREFIDALKDNLQHYSKKEIGFYAALTVAFTVALRSKYTTKLRFWG
jgi:hypothetical protein